MKKILQLFILLLVFIPGVLVQAQKLPVDAKEGRDLVIFEKVSGIFCGACPTAVHNIHDLINDGAQIGLISYQAASTYSHPFYKNEDAYGMVGYYGSLLTGYPTTIVDGHLIPGFNTPEEYAGYYNQRKALAPEFDLDIQLTKVDGDHFSVKVETTPLGATMQGTLRVVVTESAIDQLWCGETQLNDICRIMLPDYNGTVVDCSKGDFTKTFDLELASDWVGDHCKVIAYVQSDATRFQPREILGARQIALSSTAETIDAALEDVLSLNGAACQGVTYPHKQVKDIVCGQTVTPVVRLRNSGIQLLTSATISASVNGGSVVDFQWTGSLESMEVTEVTLEPVVFEGKDVDNQLLIKVSAPNGGDDGDALNDLLELKFDGSKKIGTQPVLKFKTDEWPFLNRWELVDDAGTVIEKSEDLTAYTAYEKEFDLDAGCYTFTMYDETGNGFSNYAGDDGYLIFLDSEGNELVNTIDFGYQWCLTFSTETATVVTGDDPLYTVAENKKALMIKTTADWCAPCGDYHHIFTELYEDYSEEICSFNAHVASSSIGDPMSGDMHNVINNGGGIPAFNLSGVKIEAWPPTLESILAQNEIFKAESLLGNVAFGYNIEGDKLDVTATATFFSSGSGEFYIGVFILENGIEYQQKTSQGYETIIGDRISRGSFIPDVEHMWGQMVNNSGVAAGVSYNAEFSRTLPAEWNKEQLNFVAVLWQKQGDTFKALSAEDQPADFIVGVPQNECRAAVRVMPNPVHGALRYEAPFKVQSVRMFSLTGEEVMRHDKINSAVISLEQIKPGIYFMEFSGHNNRVVNKIVVY